MNRSLLDARRGVSRCMMVLLVPLLMLVTACGESEADHEAELQRERDAIRAAIAYDRTIMDQNADSRSLGEVIFGASDETVANYVRNLRRTPLEGCPEDFVAAYQAHIAAWESRNQDRIKSTWMDVVAIARLHGVTVDLE